MNNQNQNSNSSNVRSQIIIGGLNISSDGAIFLQGDDGASSSFSVGGANPIRPSAQLQNSFICTGGNIRCSNITINNGKVNVPNGNAHSKVKPEPEPKPKPAEDPFPPLVAGNDWSHFLKTGQFSDVVFAFPNSKNLRAHKMFLIGRSPVFAAMFMHDTREKQENRIEISDVPPEVFEELLKYIYSGKTEQMEKFAVELLIAADKYALGELKTSCEEWLSTKLTKSNVSELLVLSEMINATVLNAKAEKFIKKKNVKVNPKKLLSIEQLAVVTTEDLLGDLNADKSKDVPKTAINGSSILNINGKMVVGDVNIVSSGGFNSIQIGQLGGDAIRGAKSINHHSSNTIIINGRRYQ